MLKNVLVANLALMASACVPPQGSVSHGPVIPPAVTRMLVPVHDAAGNLPTNLVSTLTPWDGSPSIEGSNTPGGALFVTPSTGGSTACFEADGFAKTCVDLTIAAVESGVTLKPLVPPLTPAFPRAQQIALQFTFEGRHCVTEQFGDLPMFDPFYISLSAPDRKHWRDCHKRDGDQAMLVGFYAEYGEAGQPFGSGQLVPPTDLTTRWNLYRAIVKETRTDCDSGVCLQTILYMSGDNGLEYLQWAMPQAVKALRPQPDDPDDLADGQEFFLCLDSCVPGYQPPSRWSVAILFARSLLTQREIISGELAAGYSSWCGGAEAMVTMTTPGECGRQDYESEAGQQLDKIYLEYPLWSTVNDQYWQIDARLLGPAYHRAPTQPSDDDQEAPFPATHGKFYLGAGTPRGPFAVGCMEATQYGDVRGWYTRQDDDDAKAYRVAQGCAVVN